ncbi:MAG TPA: HAMP domain-containing sensor histidine kinase [Aeromicrobium sp.]|nr:HAMP domain-containing sensor histidine kinase [Aeromicrobium sp.]
MRTLTARLVATTLVLVTLAAVGIGAATTVVMRSYLLNRLDHEVIGSLARAARPGLGPIPGLGPDGVPIEGPAFVRGQGVGTLTAVIEPNGSAAGVILTAQGRGTTSDASVQRDALQELAEVEPDGRPHTVSLPALGDYRVAVISMSDGRLVSGLPQSRVDDAVASLVHWEFFLVLFALGATGTVGAVLVRRQLEPLRHVAATAEEVSKLPLSSGAVDLTPRVENPDQYSEVGRVGVALNTMLAHVERSLEARQRSEQQVRQFVADASHELRTPLATIRGYSSLATAHPDDLETVRTSLAKVSAESERMSTLVEDLLLLARLDAGRELAREPVDISRLAVEVVGDARLLAPDHQWVLDVGDEPVEVSGDERSLRQVVTNLVANARVHTPAGTRITVKVRPGEVTVADDGPGFDDPDHALERFVRGDPSRASAEASTGLGLSIVDAIVRAHGGSLTIASSPGDTVVSVRLPVN